jgi:hypothetical protein
MPKKEMQKYTVKLKAMVYLVTHFHITKPTDDGNGGYRAMEMAL